MSHRFQPWQRRLAIVAPVIVVGLSVALLLFTMQQRRASTARVVATYALIDQLHAVRTRLVDAETGQRGYVITGDSAYLQPYRGAAADVQALHAALRDAVGPDSVQLALLARLESLTTRRFEILRRPMQVRSEQGFQAALEALTAGGGIGVMAELRGVLDGLERHERDQLRADLARQERFSFVALVLVLLGGALTAAVSLLTSGMFRHHAEEQQRNAGRLQEANDRLQEQALELELQAEELQASNETLEHHRGQLEEMAAELEFSNEELQRINGELEQRTREAEQANRAKTEFLTAMSHELRTPLNAIIGYVDLLDLGVHGPLQPAQHQDLARVKHNGTHLLRLINDVLHFARIRVGPMELRDEAVPVDELLNETHAVMQPLLAGKGIDYRAAAELPVPVNGDRDRIRQILLNLVSNAVKYTDRGGRIEVVAEVDGESVRIRVRDTGVGIPEEKHEQIFDPFVQLQRSAGGGLADGVGLGLSISRELARAMDGELSVSSRPGAGSTFTLTLRRAQPDSRSAAARAGGGAAAAQAD
jgi:signal transduction histidine kinase